MHNGTTLLHSQTSALTYDYDSVNTKALWNFLGVTVAYNTGDKTSTSTLVVNTGSNVATSSGTAIFGEFTGSKSYIGTDVDHTYAKSSFLSG
jgi:hypothetical protein